MDNSMEVIGAVGVLGFFLVFVLIALVIALFPFWRIVSKTGHPGALSLLFCVPLVNIIILWILALTEWPIERQVRDLQARIQLPPAQP